MIKLKSPAEWQGFFYVNENYSVISLKKKKPHRPGRQGWKRELGRVDDPPQAENPASRIFFCCLKMEKRNSVG